MNSRRMRTPLLLMVLLAASSGAADRVDPAQDARKLFEQRQPATTAASTLRTRHAQNVEQAAAILRSVGYPPSAVVGALRTGYGATPSSIYGALARSGLDRRSIADAFGANRIALDCFDTQGYPRPCGGFGGSFDQPVTGQLTWSPVETGTTGALLTVSGTNIPSVAVRIGSTWLTVESATSSKVVARLPAQPTQGSLVLRRLSDGVDGVLASTYSVIAPPLAWQSFAQPAAAGALSDMRRWIGGAAILPQFCSVNAGLVVGLPGVLSTSTGFEGRVAQNLVAAGAPAGVAAAWNNAFQAAWIAWASAVTIPSLPWYPSLALVSGPVGGPIASVPTPLAGLPSAGAAQMLGSSLKASILTALQPVSGNDPGRDEAVTYFADFVSMHFAIMMQQAVVVNVMGGGPVPTYDPPAIPAGPVVGGTCSGGPVIPNAGVTFLK